VKTVVIPPTFGGWREAARRLITEGVEPAEPPPATPPLRVPRAFLDLAESAAAHPDPERWQVLYAVLYRLAPSWAPKVLATYHPSAVLRAEDPASEARIYNLIVEDLRLAAGAIGRS
jgi:uracil-DNA glycosylase